ncbi:Indoleamine 2,3-dioxygenase [Teratosphaeria destructans]|uniref:Indoleamine 2,3-dioxygenase n=1 Tax=Teratosphaeria destructans TaxID=418781 RepID=A0A9W7SYD9_9PEZI|nr:Indoleamine 2,3-dioxygenase [Teratosphaeria destructans]
MSPHAVDTSHGAPITDSLLQKRFDVSCNGFVPATVPLHRLPNDYYEPWERIIHNLPRLLQDRTIRSMIDALEVLSIDRLESEREQRRAYTILAMFTQAYQWGGDIPAEVLPPAIAKPFLDISNKLNMPPVMTYAASNLWNFSSTSSDFSDLDSIRSTHTFTGTEDESWFFMISVAMETKAARAVPVMLRAMEAAKQKDYEFVTQALEDLQRCIQEVGSVLNRMHERCRPDVFFNQIRPFLAGSKNMAAAGLPRGVFYDQGDGGGQWIQLRGGSNGQSSLIQFWDVVLEVQHEAEGAVNPHISPPSTPVSSATSSERKSKQESFFEEVRGYMPEPHRRLLQHVEQNTTIRKFALSCSTFSASEAQRQLRRQYDATIQTLTDFRSLHIGIVTRYIVFPSKKAAAANEKLRNLATASAGSDGKEDELVGSGGSRLLPFLKQARDETARTAKDGSVVV